MKNFKNEKMKRNLILNILLVMFSAISSNAQLVNEDINFNNFISSTNNDFQNKFVQPNNYGYTMVNDGGSGFYLTTSLQGAATQSVKLCSRFKGIDTESMIISIDYKVEFYPTGGAFTSNSVGLLITKDNGEPVLTTRLSENNLYIDGLTNPNSTFSPSVFGNSFLDNNWYRLKFEITKIAIDKFSITSKIFDIGPNGLSNPTLKVTNSKEGFNYFFNSSNNINVSFVGGYWGDVRYLDNFKIYGFKNGTNCQNLSTTNNILEKKIIIYPNPVTSTIQINAKVEKINIYNINSKLISTISNVDKIINLDYLKSGTYLFELFTEDGITTEKVIKK